MIARILVGVALTVVASALAGRWLRWLYRVARAGQPARNGSRRYGGTLAGTPRSRRPR